MKFILTADDYGVSPIIDEAIEEAAEKGLITSIAAFANVRNDAGEFDVSKVKAFQQRFPHVSVGLHFTVTCGDRVSDHTRCLSPKKRKGLFGKKKRRRRFKGPESQMDKPVVKKVLDERKDHIYEELKSQLAIFEKAGIEIDHFSDHHGMVSHTKIGRKALYRVVNEYNKANNKRISIRNPLFISSLIKRRENFLHTSNCFKASAHPLAILNGFRQVVHIVSGRHKGMNTYQFKRKGQMNFLKEMNKVGIPSTNYFVDSFWGSKTEKTVREVFNKNNYNVNSKVTRPLDPEEPTVEIMLHIAKPKNRFSGDYKKEIKRLEKTKGVDPDYVKGGRVEEFKLLENFLDRYLKKKDRVSFKRYIRPVQ